MIFHAPQVVYLILFFLGLGICLERHGKPKTGEYNFLIDLSGGLIALGLLYWGGFFG
jgi:hypothetical protein